ncbi:hypothetical protein JTE90_008047 [Oedothorax gibbosus]|uniref:Uncharacterized protein n=1 Tax=Oedothorax gibbosus TaxID=931172 RepID=A0AAV6UVJ9_9ARAC|nr:hypothetical protein JTE90_008047 [Oedothorax gibbosus]
MRFFAVPACISLLVVCTSALGYGGNGGMKSGNAGMGSGYESRNAMQSGYGSGSGTGSGFGGGAGMGFGGLGGYANSKPTPFNMEYEAADEQGNINYRREVGDGNGKVQGSYGYMDNQGLYRSVEYMAGPEGFTAYVKTNEPGTDGKENPADVVMNVQETPAGIVEKYNRRAQNNIYGQGFSSMGYGGSGMSMAGYFQSGQGAKSGKSGY